MLSADPPASRPAPAPDPPHADDADLVAWVHRLDELMDGHRQSMARVASLRGEIIGRLIDRCGSVEAAATLLGVSRQALYKAKEKASGTHR